jgi:4-amino-4-deoxy-L-arabinose transferase-like glycosyltransferase
MKQCARGATWPDFKWIGLLSALLILVFRVPLAIFAPVISPDSQSYLTVARNIFENGCVSLSLPESGMCIPHWGGNHLPGYPAFAALFGANPELVLIAQNLFFALAGVYLIYSAYQYWQSQFIAICIGIVLAISPLQFGWGRFVLPDMLSNAVLLFAFAEILQSIRFGKLRWFSLGAAVSIAVFLRYDGILLTIPVAVAGLYIHGFKAGILRGMLVAAVIAVPLAGWWARSISADLGYFPQQRFMSDGSYRPAGYLAWVRSWSGNLYEAANAGYPVANKRYSAISVAENAWNGDHERETVLSLLARLSAFDGEDFPVDLDNEFGKIADDRVRANPARQYVFLPLQRAGAFWFNPYYSFGLPGIELGTALSQEDRIRFLSGSIYVKFKIVLEHPVAVLGKIGLTAYRGLLLGVLIFLVAVLKRTSQKQTRILVGSILGFVLVKVIILSFQESVDSRYLIGVFALLEISLLPGLYLFIRSRNAEA